MYKALLLLVLFGSVVHLPAQVRLVLDEPQARKNLTQAKPPITPAGVQPGKVVLLVLIGPDGRVTSAKPDSGPSKLRDAAVDAVKKWRFQPFTVKSAKVGVSTKLTVEFGPEAIPAPALAKAPAVPVDTPPIDEALQRFRALEDKCHLLVANHADPTQQASACRDAAAQAAILTGPTRFHEQRSADVFAATALMRTDDLKSAIAYGSKAIAVVAGGHDDASGASAAYAVRGQAKAFAGDLPGADADLTDAEAYERKAIAAAAGQPAEADYRAAMKGLLQFHAQLLTALKQPDQAATKTAEAGKL